MQALRNHWPAAALALFLGVLLAHPQVVAKFVYHIPFNSLSNIRSDDETLYFGRIHEVLDGYPTIGNPYLWEHKSKPPAPVFLGEYLVAQPIKLLGIGVIAGGALYDALLPPILVILLYACLWRVTKVRWLSFVGSAYLVLGPSVMDFARIVSPQFNFLFWLSQFLLLFMLFNENHAGWRRVLLIGLAAINFGMLFYLYTYYWSFYLVFLVLFLMVAAGKRARNKAVSASAVLGGGLLIAIPYVGMTFSAMALPEYHETLRRIGMIDTHFPSGIAIVVPAAVLLILIAVLAWRRLIPFDGRAAFFVSGLIAAVVSVNQHVITGKNLEFSSHYYLLSLAWFVATAAWIASTVMPKFVRFRPFIAACIIGFAFAGIARGHSDIPAWRVSAQKHVELNRYAPILDWLAANTQPDEVVFAPAGLSSFIPLYTRNNVFFTNLIRLSFISDSEIIDRFILEYYFREIDRDFVIANLPNIFGVGYIDEALHTRQENRVRKVLGLAPFPVDEVPEDLVERVLKRSAELHRSSFEVGLKKYRVDYMIRDTMTNPNSPLDRLSFLEPLATVNEFAIYRVR